MCLLACVNKNVLSLVRFTLTKDLNLQAVVEKCPLNMTGADFYALCSDAMLNAVKRKIQQLEQGTPPIIGPLVVAFSNNPMEGNTVLLL